MGRCSRASAVVWDGMARTLVRYPCAVAVACAFLGVALSGVAFGLYDFVIDTGGDSFQVREHPMRYNEDKVRVVLRDTDYRQVSDEVATVPERAVPKYALTLMITPPLSQEQRADGVAYKDADRKGNVFTDDGLELLREAEELVKAHSGYEDYCARQLVNATTGEFECMEPLSVVPFFFSDPAEGTRAPGTIDQILAGLCAVPQLKFLLTSFVAKGFECGGVNATESADYDSVATRSTIFFGAPLPGYDNVDDDSAAQDEKFDNWILGNDLDNPEDRLEEKLRVLAAEHEQDFKLVWLGSGLTAAEFDRVITNDGAFAFGAIVAVAVYVGFHTQSIFLTCFGMLHVLLSFSTGHFIMRVLFAVPSFSMLNVLSIFIILGIGADDIFIFLDAWKQAGESRLRTSPFRDEYGRVIAEEGELFTQMQYAHKRATDAMLVTSVTTAIAFAANVFSLIPPIRLFGQFTAIIVVINFLFVISWFPAMVVLYEKWIGQKTYREMLCCGKPKQRSTGGSLDGYDDDHEPKGCLGKMFQPTQKDLDELKEVEFDSLDSDYASDVDHPQALRETEDEQMITAANIGKLRLLERFFFLKWTPFLDRVKIGVIALFTILSVLAVLGALQLEPASEPERFLPDDYPIQIYLDLSAEVFKQSAAVSQVQFCFGVESLDVEGVDSNDPFSVGKVIYNDDFASALATVEGQAVFDAVCDAAREAENTRRNELTDEPEVLCFTDVWRTYLRTQANDSSVELPVGSAFLPALLDFVENYDYPQGATAGLFDQVARGSEQTVRFLEPEEEGGQRRFVFASIVVNTTLESTAPAVKTLPVFEEYEAIVEDTVDRSDFPDGFEGLFQTSDRYPRAQTELVLLQTAILGIIISIVLSAVIISIFTRNLILTPLIIVSVGGIIVTMLGMVWALGWTLGIIESVCITILTGLSIDYVVHLGIAVNDSRAVGKFDRVRNGLTTMGISVLSAAITTLCSSAFLLGTTVLFFVRFGIFLLLTIAIATLWSFIFFASSALLVAPKHRGHCGLHRKDKD